MSGARFSRTRLVASHTTVLPKHVYMVDAQVQFVSLDAGHGGCTKTYITRTQHNNSTSIIA